LVIPKRPGLVAAKRAPDSRPRSGSFGKGHNGCAQRRTGHCRLLPHSTLRAPGRSRFREGAPAVAVGVEPGRLRLLPHSTLRAPGRNRRRATPECAKRASSLRVAAKKRVCVLFVSSMRLTPSGLARRFAPGETVLGLPVCAPDAWPRSVPRTRGGEAALSGRGTTAAFHAERGTVGCSRTRRCAHRVAAAFGQGRQRLRSPSCNGALAAAPALDAGAHRGAAAYRLRLAPCMCPGLVAAKRAPDSWRRSRSFGKGHNGCVRRGTGHCRLLPHSTLRTPGRSRLREGAQPPQSRPRTGRASRARTRAAPPGHGGCIFWASNASREDYWDGF